MQYWARSDVCSRRLAHRAPMWVLNRRSRILARGEGRDLQAEISRLAVAHMVPIWDAAAADTAGHFTYSCGGVPVGEGMAESQETCALRLDPGCQKVKSGPSHFIRW